MAKTITNSNLNLPVVMNWWLDVLSAVDVPSIQQLAMFHVIGRLNKNFWSPAQISITKLAATMNSDKRTVKKAVDALIASNWLTNVKGGVIVNVARKALSDDRFGIDSGNITAENDLARITGGNASVVDLASFVSSRAVEG